MDSASILLADGTHVEGLSLGYVGTSAGELCFNTSMTGYQEIYTDPSYVGQIIVHTLVHIGNYGVCSTEAESDKVRVNGVVVSDASLLHSRCRASSSLRAYFGRHKVVCVCGIDTRRLVRHIVRHGAMNAVLSSEGLSLASLEKTLSSVPAMQGCELASLVTTSSAYVLNSEGKGGRIAVLDFGVKRSILRYLERYDFHIKVFPARTSVKVMEAWHPSGYVLSNGPGDPQSMPYAITTTKALLALKKPLFGICLGHQLLALACGASTYKLRFGHRGANHPVLHLGNGVGSAAVTSQNHGFAIDRASLASCSNVAVTHVHLNDNTVAGLRVLDAPAFSVQYHPESSPGPHDSHYLFEEFKACIKTHSV